MRFNFINSLFLLTLVLAPFCVSISAQGQVPQEDSLVRHSHPATGKLHFLGGLNHSPLGLPKGVTPDLEDPLQALRIYGAEFGIRYPEVQLQLLRTEKCNVGQIHHTFQQVYRGVEVLTGNIKVHLKADGTPLSINGDFYSVPKKLEIAPKIGSEQALELAARELEQELLIETDQPRLVIVNPGWYGDDPIDQPVLAHHLVAEGDGMMAKNILVDARTGVVLDHWPAVHSALLREIYDGAGGGGLPGTLARTEGSPASGDLDIDNSYDTCGDLYRVLSDSLGRDSLDGNGGPMIITANWNSNICPNAIWNGTQGAFCNGLGTDDIIAHELAHGLTQFTANLIYQNQSGQLNEAMSDIFGEVIDLYNGNASVAGTPGGTPWPVPGTSGSGLDTPNTPRTGCSDGSARWRMGEESSLGAIRDMFYPECFNDPPSTTDPLYNQNACGPFDNGGVHIGSGVLNHSFAMLVDGKTYNGQTITPIGMTKATAVYFRALSVYMTQGTSFPQAEIHINQAAADLINTNPIDPRTGVGGGVFTQADADIVASVMTAVGMSELVCGQVPPGPPPANDNCDAAVPVFLGLNDVDSNNATTGGPAPDDTACPGTFIGDCGNDIWYSYTAPENGLLSVSLCSIVSWDTDLQIFDGNCGALNLIACNGDFGGCSTFTSQVDNVPVIGGSNYLIRVSSWSDGTTGTGQMDVTFVPDSGTGVENCTNGVDDDGDGLADCEDADCATNPVCIPPAAGDECVSAELASLGTNPFDSTNATTGTDPIPDPATCNQGLGDMLGDIWFEYVPTESGSLFVSTCSPGSFDTDLVAYTGSCASLITLACNGDVTQNTSPTCQQYWSEVTIDVIAGETYWFRIGAWGTPHPGNGLPGPGALILDLTPSGPVEDCSNGSDDDADGLADCEDPDCLTDPACVPAIPGDECDTAVVAVLGSNAIDTTGATTGADPIDDSNCTGTFLGEFVQDVWYQFTPSSTGEHVISTCDTINFDSDILVYSGSCGALTPIACNGDGTGCGGLTSSVSANLNAGETVLIRVGGWNAAAVGTGTLEISSVAPPPPPENCTNGVDDDQDGLSDCEDPDCFADPDCNCLPISNLLCIQGSGTSVNLSWNNGEAYQEISVMRGGAQIAVLPGSSSSYVDSSAPLGNQTYSLVPSCTPIQQAPMENCSVDVVQTIGFMFSAGDVDGSYSASGATFESEISLMEMASNPGFPTDTAGFSLGLAHDSALFEATGAQAVGPLAALDGGAGPAFFDTSVFADGIGIGCVYDFSLSQSIQFTSATGIVSVAYAALPGALSGASGTVTSSLDFVQTLGTPPVELIVSTAAGSAVPAGGNSGSISLNPSGFVMTAVDQSVEYPESTGEASVTVSITLEEDPGNTGFPNETQAFSFGLVHDPVVLTGQGINAASILTALNGNTGPDFFDVNSFADGMTVGCVYTFVGTDVLTFATATELVTVDYSTVAAGLIGAANPTVTQLQFSQTLGTPPVELVVVVGAASQGVQGETGTITLTPVTGTGFVRADINDDAVVNLADAVQLLNALFLGGVTNCDDAADTNDDELKNIADAVYLLSYLFTSGPDIPEPGGNGSCGTDPVGDALDCAEYNSCP